MSARTHTHTNKSHGAHILGHSKFVSLKALVSYMFALVCSIINFHRPYRIGGDSITDQCRMCCPSYHKLREIFFCKNFFFFFLFFGLYNLRWVSSSLTNFSPSLPIFDSSPPVSHSHHPQVAVRTVLPYFPWSTPASDFRKFPLWRRPFWICDPSIYVYELFWN